jgi:hypothetical protein
MSAGAATPARAAPRTRSALAPAELTWLLTVPAALVLLAVVVLLGPPLGRLLAPSSVPAFTAALRSSVRPEPTEHARYLLAALAPLGLAVAVVLLARRGTRPARPRAIGLAVLGSEALVAAFLVATVVVQHGIRYRYSAGEAGFHRVYFTWPALAFAAAAAASILVALRRETVVRRLGDRLRETPRRTIVARAVAVLFTLAWLLAALNSDRSASAANLGVSINLRYWLDETFAVLDGRHPLVTFHAQYAQLWPYVTAAWMALVGASVTTYSAIMVAGTTAAMLAIFGVLARITRNALAALGLYLPFVATSFFTEHGPPDNRYGPVNAFSMFPIRYGGAYLLAWLTARTLDGARPRRWRWVFAAAGLVAINDLDFGLPALAATCAALLAAGVVRRGNIARLAGEALLGLSTAIAAVSLLTLVVAGSLPDFGLLLEFPRIFGVYGFGMLPLRAFGLHLALYVTFAAAIAVAAVRALGGERDRVLTAMLMWSGVYGLGAGSYFVGRSHPEVLVDLFSAWALALVLLVVVVARELRRPASRVRVAHVAVLVGFGIAIASIAQTPTPWSQMQRLGRGGSSYDFPTPRYSGFLERATRRGERIALFLPLGHRAAYELGLDNVSPYASSGSVPLVRQFTDTLRILRESGGHKAFLLVDDAFAERKRILRSRGFRLVRTDAGSATAELSDEPVIRRSAHR